MFVVNQNSVVIDVLDRQTGQVLSSLGGGPDATPGSSRCPTASASIQRATSTLPNRKAGACRSSESSTHSASLVQSGSCPSPD